MFYRDVTPANGLLGYQDFMETREVPNFWTGPEVCKIREIAV